jgi:hypothetical protein
MRHALTILALFAAACGPPGPDVDLASQRTFLVYDYDSDEQTYRLHEAEIRTLTDARTISGDVAELRGGGKLVTVHADPQTREEIADSLEVRNDRTPSAEYLVEDGVAIPYDFDTQMMVTLYHHLERANEFFTGLGVEEDRVGRLPVYYYPQISVLGISIPLFNDNAAYAFTLNAFLIPPRLIFQEDVPLSANRGVIVHEYSHAVFNRIVHKDRRVPDYLADQYTAVVTNYIRSLDEGLADVFAGLSTKDPNFISSSIATELFDIDRDLSKKRIWDGSLDLEISQSDTGNGQRNPYILGSVIASSIWATRDFLDDETIGRTTLAAMDAISTPGPSFGLDEFFDAWLDNMPQEQRSQACDIFVERLELIDNQLDCP